MTAFCFFDIAMEAMAHLHMVYGDLPIQTAMFLCKQFF